MKDDRFVAESLKVLNAVIEQLQYELKEYRLLCDTLINCNDTSKLNQNDLVRISRADQTVALFKFLDV